MCLAKVEVGSVGIVVDAWKAEGVGREGGLHGVKHHLLDIRVQGQAGDVGDGCLWAGVCRYRVGEAEWCVGTGVRHEVGQCEVQ